METPTAEQITDFQRESATVRHLRSILQVEQDQIVDRIVFLMESRVKLMVEVQRLRDRLGESGA